jgi:lactate dehydrogenase-like 2-hydroxyacid dehydrogenase
VGARICKKGSFMSRELLVLHRLPDAQLEQLRERFTVHLLSKAEDPEETLRKIGPGVQGVVASFWAPVSGRLIAALPNLEIIANFGVGTDHVDMDAARKRRIVVTNTPDILSDDVADIAMGLALCVLRRLVEGDIYVRSGQWAKKGMLPLGRCMKGKTMGIVGLGRIGSAIAKRAEAFGVKVVYHGPHVKKGARYPHYSDLRNMAEISDILMISCRYEEGMHHMIDARILKALGKKGILVNIARGRIVNEAALIDALEGGVIAGAGLDVYEKEPDVPAALCRLDNVVLQPHVGSGTHETRTAMAQLVVDNVMSYFERGEVLTAV